MARSKATPKSEPPAEEVTTDPLEGYPEGTVEVVGVTTEYTIREVFIPSDDIEADDEVKYEWVNESTGEDSFVLFDTIEEARADIHAQN